VAAGRKKKGETFSLSRRHTTLRLATRQVDQVVDDTDMVFALFRRPRIYTSFDGVDGQGGDCETLRKKRLGELEPAGG
jgi:hypothetical protein